MASDHNSIPFRLMTYNIRMDTPVDGPNQWHHRRQRLISLIEKYQPDLLGVQEPVPQQMSDLRSGLTAYNSYGVGRNDGNNDGEFAGIFFNRNRYELIDQGTFWFSEKPDKPGSKGWDAHIPRICSWVKLKDRTTNKEICFFNVHFDHKGHIARRESARLLLSKIEQITGSSIPTVITGDFNDNQNSDCYQIINTNTMFQDAKSISETSHSGPQGTWSTFDVNYGIGEKIDYIFVTPSHLRVLKHSHITDSENSFYPSDHLPVLVEATFKSLQ